jgi:L-alanine-DL-glutamate epimerase-like enolase superfamily enzyme
VTAGPVRSANGHAEAIDRPGLGVEVDEARVRAHRAG